MNQLRHQLGTNQYPMKHKSKVPSIFLKFHVFVEKQLSSKILALQTDWGGEFRHLLPILEKFGILFGHPCPYTHQQQRRFERKHRHIIDLSLTLLAQAIMPLKFWWDACVSSVFIINRLPTKVLANFSLILKTFLVLNLITYISKFLVVLVVLTYVLTMLTSFFSSPPSDFFLSYRPTHKGYRCLSPSSRIYVAKSVTFNENDFPYSTLFAQPNTPH